MNIDPDTVLDLCCGAGGAGYGYWLAGYQRIIGVDSQPQPYYPFEFRQADALDVLREILAGTWRPALVHASFPCHGWSAYRRRPKLTSREYPDLITPGRPLLQQLGVPYVIENVPGAPLHDPVTYCGSSFNLDVQRHRWFESSVPLAAPPCNHGIWTPRFPPATNRVNKRKTVEIGVYRIPLSVQREAMGISWMTLGELSQAIPPAYTKHVGEQIRERAAVRPDGKD